MPNTRKELEDQFRYHKKCSAAFTKAHHKYWREKEQNFGRVSEKTEKAYFDAKERVRQNNAYHATNGATTSGSVFSYVPFESVASNVSIQNTGSDDDEYPEIQEMGDLDDKYFYGEITMDEFYRLRRKLFGR